MGIWLVSCGMKEWKSVREVFNGSRAGPPLRNVNHQVLQVYVLFHSYFASSHVESE